MATITPELIDLWKKTTPELVTWLAKKPTNAGFVSYLSPAAVVNNHNQDPIPAAVLKALQPYLKNSEGWNIPMSSYKREALFQFQTTNPLKYKKTMQQDYPIALDGTVDG